VDRLSVLRAALLRERRLLHAARAWARRREPESGALVPARCSSGAGDRRHRRRYAREAGRGTSLQGDRPEVCTRQPSAARGARRGRPRRAPPRDVTISLSARGHRGVSSRIPRSHRHSAPRGSMTEGKRSPHPPRSASMAIQALFCMAGITLTPPILAVLRIPQTTLFILGSAATPRTLPFLLLGSGATPTARAQRVHRSPRLRERTHGSGTSRHTLRTHRHPFTIEAPVKTAVAGFPEALLQAAGRVADRVHDHVHWSTWWAGHAQL